MSGGLLVARWGPACRLRDRVPVAQLRLRRAHGQASRRGGRAGPDCGPGRDPGRPTPGGGQRAVTRNGDRRVIVAGVGNVLRRDDGFGPAVVARLEGLPDEVEVIETGIGGVALLQELLAGCDGLVVIDAVDRGERPGTVFVIEPEISEGEHVPDLHLANPDRVLAMAKSMGALPERVLIVGCQPSDTEELDDRLSPDVDRSVEVAATKVREAVDGWLR